MKKEKILTLFAIVLLASFCFSINVKANSISPILYSDADLQLSFDTTGTTTININGQVNKKIKEIVIRTNRISGSYNLELYNNGQYASSTIGTFNTGTLTTFRSQDGSCHGNNSCITVSDSMPGTGYSYISNNAATAAIKLNKKNIIGDLRVNGAIYVFYA